MTGRVGRAGRAAARCESAGALAAGAGGRPDEPFASAGGDCDAGAKKGAPPRQAKNASNAMTNGYPERFTKSPRDPRASEGARRQETDAGREGVAAGGAGFRDVQGPKGLQGPQGHERSSDGGTS